jgi:hypothetical protein
MSLKSSEPFGDILTGKRPEVFRDEKTCAHISILYLPFLRKHFTLGEAWSKEMLIKSDSRRIYLRESILNELKNDNRSKLATSIRIEDQRQLFYLNWVRSPMKLSADHLRRSGRKDSHTLVEEIHYILYNT